MCTTNGMRRNETTTAARRLQTRSAEPENTFLAAPESCITLVLAAAACAPRGVRIPPGRGEQILANGMAGALDLRFPARQQRTAPTHGAKPPAWQAKG